MEKALIITGEKKDGRPIAGVFFTNKDNLSFDQLNSLGFSHNIQKYPAEPLLREPSEPTLYIYDRSPYASGLEIVRLDWNGDVVNRVAGAGTPSDVIPPVSGDAAERYLYTPRAHLITADAKMNGSPAHVFGVLFVKPQPGKPLLKPDASVLKGLGLKTTNVCPVALPDGYKGKPILYLVERSPSATFVREVKLDYDGSLESDEMRRGAPGDIIPRISGDAAARFNRMFECELVPPSSSGKSQRPPSSRRPSQIPQPSKRQSQRPPPSKRHSKKLRTR